MPFYQMTFGLTAKDLFVVSSKGTLCQVFGKPQITVNSFLTMLIEAVSSPPVWPDWALYWTLGNFLKPLATMNLSKSPTFLGNFCKGVKIEAKKPYFSIREFLDFPNHLILYCTKWWTFFHIYHIFLVKNVMFALKRRKLSRKEAVDGPSK